ncbi:MAG: hypothetical protein QN174_11465 [Armatimonadota bacterium]|nr:hypothetical protein [Armatimonadota bacterium]MDR7497561.1 hypothetical protein [Armatimonadota bacterium]MDR7512201.1 hypothetical protein [Armatimonadota bacterium]
MIRVPTVLTLVAVGFALATHHVAAQSLTILPGRSIGPIELGMPLDRARGIMETWGTVEEVETPTLHGFCNPDRGVGVCAFDRVSRMGLDTPGAVALVLTDDSRFTTDAGGHKVGEPLLGFLRTYGLYSGGQGSEVRWEARGLSVDVGPGERGIAVRLISVFAPRPVSAQAP